MRTFLFAGHMVDAPGREPPRFPAAAVPSARDAISRTLDSLRPTPNDRAIASGACGGDLLFAQAALARGLPLICALPFAEERFRKESVEFAGAEWVEAFEAVRANPRARVVVLADRDDPPPTADTPYAGLNRWLLDAAFTCDPHTVHLICLWNGQSGDGPGGTAELVADVRWRGGSVHWIDTRHL